MFRSPEQLQPGRVVGRDGIGVITAHVEPIGKCERYERFCSVGGGAADVLKRCERCIRDDQIRDVVVKIRRTEAKAVLKERLLEPEIVSLAFLWLQIGIREKIECRKTNEQLGQARRLKSGAVARLQLGTDLRNDVGRRDSPGGFATEAFVLVPTDTRRGKQIVDDLRLQFSKTGDVAILSRDRAL